MVKSKIFKRFYGFVSDLKDFTDIAIYTLSEKQLIKTYETWKVLSDTLTIDKVKNSSLVAGQMWSIVDELIDIMLLLAETKYGYKLEGAVREEVRVVEVDDREEERRRGEEMEEHWRIQERLRVAQEERRRLEEAEMWRQRRFRARQ
jgi:hypothetical protein